jgi:hypothetical protein
VLSIDAPVSSPSSAVHAELLYGYRALHNLTSTQHHFAAGGEDPESYIEFRPLQPLPPPETVMRDDETIPLQVSYWPGAKGAGGQCFNFVCSFNMKYKMTPAIDDDMAKAINHSWGSLCAFSIPALCLPCYNSEADFRSNKPVGGPTGMLVLAFFDHVNEPSSYGKPRLICNPTNKKLHMYAEVPSLKCTPVAILCCPFQLALFVVGEVFGINTKNCDPTDCLGCCQANAIAAEECTGCKNYLLLPPSITSSGQHFQCPSCHKVSIYNRK